MDDTPHARLEQTLASKTYEEILDPAQQKAILAEADALAGLRAIVQRTASPMNARFLAAELLFAQPSDFPSAADAASLPPIYAWAIANQPTGNVWGLPGDDDGPAGPHVVRIGPPMVAALIPLFQDERLLPFEGSIEATFANLWQVRVKDIAASLAARILKQPFPKQADQATRDAFIQGLAAMAPT